MTAGSTWAIYPAGTLKVTDDTPKVGLVEIASVARRRRPRRTSCPRRGSRRSRPGTKAIEESHHYGEMRLVVGVRVPDEELSTLGEKLHKLLTDSELIQSAQPDEQADVTAWLVRPRSTVRTEDPVPQLACGGRGDVGPGG